jgi:hypothetical protein
MKSVKSFLGIGQHKPIPGSKPNFKDSIAEVFSRIGFTPKLSKSIGILTRFKNFLLRFKEGEAQAKDRTSQIGGGIGSSHVKKTSKPKNMEEVEFLLHQSPK